MSPLGGAGVHVQPDCGNRSSDDAPSIRRRRLGGQLVAHLLPGVHEVQEVDAVLGPPPYRHGNTNQELMSAYDLDPKLCSTTLLLLAGHQ